MAAVPWHPEAEVRRGAAIALGTLILWISEVAPLGVTAILIPVAAALSGVLTWPEAVGAWGDPIVFLFLGAFLLARALEKHRAFDWMMNLGGSGAWKTGWVTLGILMLSGSISTLQNNTAVAAMLLPVALRLARRAHAPAVLIALAWGSTFGGMATPVGTAPNFIGYAAMKKLDAGLSFLSWMKVGVPVWLGTTAIGWVVLSLADRWSRAGQSRQSRSRPESCADAWTDADVGPVLASPTLVTDPSARRWAMGAFGMAAAVWIGTGLVLSATTPDHAWHQWTKRYLPESMVPVALAWMLFLVRTGAGRRPVLDRHDFQALDWDTLFLIAGGLTLGRVLERSGAAAALAEAVAGSSLSPGMTMLALAAATTLLSELTSNTATASLMVPIAGALAPAVGLEPVQAIWLVALSASLGFALPVSTPPNAIVYGTRLVPLRFMASTGIVVDVLSVIWVTCCVWWWG